MKPDIAKGECLAGAVLTRLFVLGVLMMLFLAGSGCAVHYFDRATGTEHLWGLGHLKMRAVPQHSNQPPWSNAVTAFVTGNQTLGLSLGTGPDHFGFAAGWDSRSRLNVIAPDTSFYLLWPTNSIWLPWQLRDLFTVRVGPDFPFTNGVQTPKTPNGGADHER